MTCDVPKVFSTYIHVWLARGKDFKVMMWLRVRGMGQGDACSKGGHHMGQGSKGRAMAGLVLVTCCHAASEAGLDRGSTGAS